MGAVIKRALVISSPDMGSGREEKTRLRCCRTDSMVVVERQSFLYRRSSFSVSRGNKAVPNVDGGCTYVGGREVLLLRASCIRRGRVSLISV